MSGKDNQKTITVKLNHINNYHNLEKICNFFCENRPKQGIIINGSPMPDLSVAQQIKFSFIDMDGKYFDPVTAVSEIPNKYMYAVYNGMEYPVIASYISTSQEDKMLISDGKKYRQWHPIKRVLSEHNSTLIIDDTIKITLNKQTNKFTFSVDEYYGVRFDQVCNASELLIVFFESDILLINDLELPQDIAKIIKERMKEKFIEAHKYLLFLKNTLLEINISPRYFTVQEVKDAELEILGLHRALLEKCPVGLDVSKDKGIACCSIGNKKIILEYNKISEDKFLISDFLSQESDIVIFYQNVESKKKLAKWVTITPEYAPETLFDRKRMLEDLSKNCSPEDTYFLTNIVLAFLNDYDKTKNIESLDFAKSLNKIIEETLSPSEHITINRSQIKYRTKGLDEKDRQELLLIKTKSDNYTAVCCSCILLGCYDEFYIYFNDLTQEEQTEFKKWPIYNLIPEDRRK